jgi:hypothetical protein
MQRNLTAVIATALMAMSVTALAQNTDQSAQTAPTAAQENQKDPADPSKGQDLVNPKPTDTNPMKSPPTVGHDKAAGNNLVGADNTGQMQMAAPTDFKTLDMKGHGFVVASEVKNPWLKQNFSKCDANSDGKVTQAEYGICSKQK